MEFKNVNGLAPCFLECHQNVMFLKIGERAGSNWSVKVDDFLEMAPHLFNIVEKI